MNRPPYDWQRFVFIHGGELLPNGLPRFRDVWVIVARQNGKTEIPVMLSGYWMFIDAVPLILGTSTKLEYAKESWMKLVAMIRKSKDPGVLRMIPNRKWWREANGEQEAWVYRTEAQDPFELSRYKIAAANEDGGRSLTVHKGICDEIRQHRDYTAWSAIKFAMRKVGDAQLWCLSNAGTAKSRVLNEARAQHLDYIRTGVGNARSGWFEYSAPEGSAPDDPVALAMANPEFNRSFDGEELVNEGRAALAEGGDKLAKFFTEAMCITRGNLKPAYNEARWIECKVPGTLDGLRDRVALVFDVAPDNQHATLVAAATGPDGRTRVEPVAAWSHDDADHPMAALTTELKAHVRDIKPKAFGWLPNGPAAAYAADMRKTKDGKPPAWIPAGCKVEALRGEAPDVCMGFEVQINTLNILHSDDPLMNAHVLGAEQLPMPGGRWVLSRKAGHVDCAYAAAGAVHLARTLPPPLGKPRLIVVTDDE
jgi:phage terminase large subunit-like protein